MIPQAFITDVPSTKTYLDNIAAKMDDEEFLGDIKALIRPTTLYDPIQAFNLLRSELFVLI